MLEAEADHILNLFLAYGHERVREYLELESDADFQSVFDFLVFEKNMLYTLVTEYDGFFGTLMREYGPFHIRRVLGIEAKKYDSAFQPILEFLGIAKQDLYLYVIREKSYLYETMFLYDSKTVRKMLCINSKNYDDVWLEILDILFDNVCARALTLQRKAHIEKLLETFSRARRNQLTLPLGDTRL